MSDSSGTWTKQTGPAHDSLQAYNNKPLFSDGGPGSQYLGRVVIEFWEHPGARDDGDKIALRVDAMDGKHGEFLVRVAEAITKKLTRGNPFKDTTR